jgi:hypothetical protein
MPLDPSIALGIKPVQAPNPIAMLGDMAKTQYMITNGNALQAQLNSNRAMSQALSGAINPDGTIDYGKAVAGMKDSPYAYNLPTMMGQLLDQQTKQVGLNQAQWEYNLKQANQLANNMAPLLQQDTIKPEDVVAIGARNLKQGLITPQQFTAGLADMPQDPGALKQWVQQKWEGAMAHADQLKAMTPQYMTMNNGASQDVRNINPFATNAPNFHFQNQMAPSDANAPVTIPAAGPNTPPKMVTKAQFAGQAEATPGGIVAGQTPAAQTYQTKVADNAAATEQDLLNRVSGGASLMHNLQEQQQLLTQARAGGGSNWRAEAASKLQAMGIPQSVVDQVAGGNLGAAQTLQKLMVQGAVSQMKSMMSGHQTEGQMNAFLSANPNLDKDPRALDKITQFYNGIYQNDVTQQHALNQWKQQNPGQDTSGFFQNYAVGPTQQAFSAVKGGNAPTVVKTGTYNGRKVVQYSDGSVRYAQ